MIYWFILLRVRGLVVSEVIATFGVGLAILELFRYLGFIGFEYTLPPLIDASVMIGDTYVDAQRLCIVGTGILLAAFPVVLHPLHQDRPGLSGASPRTSAPP